jgi:hypothetical protein
VSLLKIAHPTAHRLQKSVVSGFGRSDPEMSLDPSKSRAPETVGQAPECGLNGKEITIVQFNNQWKLRTISLINPFWRLQNPFESALLRSLSKWPDHQ